MSQLLISESWVHQGQLPLCLWAIQSRNQRYLPALLQTSCETSLPCSLPAFSPAGDHQFLLWQHLSHTLCISVRKMDNIKDTRYHKNTMPMMPEHIYLKGISKNKNFCWIWGDWTVFQNY